jgi:hypothetical protein
MVKKTTRTSKIKSIPSSFLILGIASLMLNAVVLLSMIGGYVVDKSGQLDTAFINNAIERMCSDQFRQTVNNSSKSSGDSDNDRKLRLALVDYECSKNGADTFYTKGYDDYVRSLGLQQQTN